MDKLRTCKHSTSSKSLRLKKQPAAGCLEDQMEVHSASLKNFVGTYDPTIENKKISPFIELKGQTPDYTWSP
jgi:hypothetical protein